ncbi:hypothetical protein FB567DRAFT_620472 [Paraphoma chrysanthemicola]|uniref:Uncharacterized protein n=1 Tax=Paraphoma chrysanthemicola TaxID=798071 RepID=A0A8K0R7E9_9PLEO|nr:hypothetical protein FB567DRAFT_620472 [Paraphoma chrysanthemicola]
MYGKKQGKLWDGRFMYFPQSFPQQLDHLAEYLNGDPDPKAQVRINIGYAHQVGDIMCMNDPTYTKPEKPDAFAAFTDIEPRVPHVDTLRIGTVSEMANEQSAQSEYNKRVIYLTTTLKASPAVLHSSLDNFYTGYEALKSAAGLVFAATYEPYPTSLLTNGAGHNSLGINPEDGPLVLFLLYVSWTYPKDDDMIVQASKDTLERIQRAAREMGQGHMYVYMNYAFPRQDPVASYGDEVRRELQAVSEKYDPMGFFQRAVSGGFKLS